MGFIDCFEAKTVKGLGVFIFGVTPGLVCMIIALLNDNFDASTWAFFQFVWCFSLLYSVMWKKRPRKKTTRMKIIKMIAPVLALISSLICCICSFIRQFRFAGGVGVMTTLWMAIYLVFRIRRNQIAFVETGLGPTLFKASPTFSSNSDPLADPPLLADPDDTDEVKMATEYESVPSAGERYETVEEIQYRRRCFANTDKIFAVIRTTVTIILVVLVFGALIQSIAVTRDWVQYGPNELVVLPNGEKLNFVCQEPNITASCAKPTVFGAACPADQRGSPITIILEPGVPFTSISWSNVLSAKYAGSQLSQYRVCAYDRHGYGWSSRVTGHRDGLRMVEDLRAGLEAKGVPPPYIYVGWSYGGLMAQLYHANKSSDLAGVVLVDTSYPAMTNDTDFTSELKSGLFAFNLYRLFNPIGFVRLGQLFGTLPPECGLPSTNQSLEAQARTYTYMFRGNFGTAAYSELLSFDQTLRQASEKFLPHKFGSTPVVIVSSNTHELARKAFENSILADSPNSTAILRTDSNHYVPYNDPQVIVSAILKCLQLIAASKP